MEWSEQQWKSVPDRVVLLRAVDRAHADSPAGTDQEEQALCQDRGPVIRRRRLSTAHDESDECDLVARRSDRDGRREPAAAPDRAAPENAADTPIMKPKLYQLPLLCTS